MSNFSSKIRLIWITQASQVALVVKNLSANAGNERDAGWIPGMGRSPGEGNGNPLQCSCLENPRDGGAWWAAVYGVAQSRTRLKQLSSSSTQTFQYFNHWFSPALAVLLTLLLCPWQSCLIISPGLVRSFIIVLFVIARVWKQPKCNKEGTGW